MKKKIFIICLFALLLLSTCSNDTCYDCTKNYSGYIVDSLTKQPVSGVLVKDIKSELNTFSDSLGYFIIPYSDKYPDSKLLFYKKKFANDTINATYWVYNHGEQLLRHRYFRGEKIEIFYYKDKKK